MRTKYARWIREGIMQAKRYEHITSDYWRLRTVHEWARAMYCYGDHLATNEGFHIATAMVSYTEKQIISKGTH